ncbi:Tar ligand binding domain-containing protein [Nitrosospira sp. Nsp1]|uniref:Tar ligand binding domain-containing protein n=1 Tax=Nitrosospira sp. Nsp1 TaxID=136547 RepID=UPI0008891719|nr:Tar ligand binding domain-containing protein [Nitrosospira sp. Nsp1]SCX58793.1 PAS domain S-box-containing protein [Nitrosospira sp. Nsp1]
MFKNLTIKSRLIFILSFLLIFVLGIQVVGLFGMSSAIDGLKTVYHDRAIPLSQVTHIESLLLHNRLAITSALVMPTPEIIETKTAMVEKNIGTITRTWEAYIATNLTPMESKLANKFALDHKKYVFEGILPAVAALRANKIGEANRILVEKIRPLYPPVGESIDALVLLQVDETKIKYTQEQKRYETVRNILIASIVLALVLAALFSLVFIRAIFRPLEDVVSIARSVAAGNLRQEIQVRSKDEIGQLMQALKEMRDSLVDTIGQVRDSEAHTRALLNNLIVGVTSVDEQGVIRTFNPAAERIFGYPESEIIGQNIELLFPQQDQSQGRHIDYLENYLKTGSRALGVTTEVAGLRRNGATFPLDIAVVEMHGGERRMFVVILRDISERKLVEEQKASLMADLESANEELKSFAYVVSHDLKAPLRAIGALADWLSTDYVDKFDDEGREHMRLLVSRVHRMGNLIDGILQYSRVGRVRETPVAVDVGEVVEDVIELLAPPPNINITVENHLPTVVIEPTRIQQILQNLISNAIKYMDKPRGEIRITCIAEGEQWKFSVVDNGPGIESRHFERIFQLFQTLAPRDRIESTGVGLALVKKIVEMYGGSVWVESTMGKGSTFFFTLPQTSSIDNSTKGTAA